MIFCALWLVHALSNGKEECKWLSSKSCFWCDRYLYKYSAVKKNFTEKLLTNLKQILAPLQNIHNFKDMQQCRQFNEANSGRLYGNYHVCGHVPGIFFFVKNTVDSGSGTKISGLGHVYYTAKEGYIISLKGNCSQPVYLQIYNKKGIVDISSFRMDWHSTRRLAYG